VAVALGVVDAEEFGAVDGLEDGEERDYGH